MPAGAQPSVTVRNGKGSRFRVVPDHPELVDAFRSVSYRSPSDKVFTGHGGKRLSTRTAARWTAEGIRKRDCRRPLREPASKGQPATGCSPA